MPDDIVILLRKYQPYSKLHGQAADEIEMLRQLLDAYRLICRLFTGIGDTGLEEE